MSCTDETALALYKGKCSINSFWNRGLQCQFNHETNEWEYKCICNFPMDKYGENDNCSKWTPGLIITFISFIIMVILSVWMVQYIYKKYNALKRDIGGNFNIKWHTKVVFYYGMIGFSITALAFLINSIMYIIPPFDNDENVIMGFLKVGVGLFSMRNAFFHPLSALQQLFLFDILRYLKYVI